MADTQRASGCNIKDISNVLLISTFFRMGMKIFEIQRSEFASSRELPSPGIRAIYFFLTFFFSKPVTQTTSNIFEWYLEIPPRSFSPAFSSAFTSDVDDPRLLYYTALPTVSGFKGFSVSHRALRLERKSREMRKSVAE